MLDSPVTDTQSLTLQVSPYSIFDASTIRIESAGTNTYDITAQLAHDAPVGVFTVGVKLSDRAPVMNLPKQIAVLFNAWNPADKCYMEKPTDLNEYVLNEHGITYRGTTRSVQAVRWYFAQFDHNTLRVLLHLLNRLDEKSRKSPALTARYLTSAMVQQPTNPDGLMVGRWEAPYPGGVNPMSWSSSDQIISRYIAQGFQAVKYAQCWVFAAVYNSFLRGVGIPARPITTFDSAHEIPVSPGVYNQEILRYWDPRARRMIAEVGVSDDI